MLSDDSLFAAKTKEILTDWSRPDYAYPSTPLALLKGWAGVIAECKQGYPYNIYEYDNDLSIRIVIEQVLSSEIAKEYPEFIEFSEKVKSLDDAFSEFLQKDITRPSHRYWWQQRVPRYGCEELANDFLRNYEIKVEIV